jgi:hypothetical protein
MQCDSIACKYVNESEGLYSRHVCVMTMTVNMSIGVCDHSIFLSCERAHTTT